MDSYDLSFEVTRLREENDEELERMKELIGFANRRADKAEARVAELEKILPNKSQMEIFRASAEGHKEGAFDWKLVPNQWLKNERALAEGAVAELEKDKARVNRLGALDTVKAFDCHGEVLLWHCVTDGDIRSFIDNIDSIEAAIDLTAELDKAQQAVNRNKAAYTMAYERLTEYEARADAAEAELREIRKVTTVTEAESLPVYVANLEAYRDELETDKARVIRVAEQLLRMFGTPTLRDDAAVYTCHAEANIRTLEGISDAINAAKEE